MIDIDAERGRFERWADSSGVDFPDEHSADVGLMVWLAAKRDATTNEVSHEQAAG